MATKQATPTTPPGRCCRSPCSSRSIRKYLDSGGVAQLVTASS